MIVCPGSLAEQWQDEIDRRFHLPFEIMTNDKLESARTGNWFQENNLVIGRLDKLSRNEDVQEKLQAPDVGPGRLRRGPQDVGLVFRRRDQGHQALPARAILSALTRHFLLMTATPHNGKEEDFQFFMALLDGDRFEGKFRDGVHAVDASDLMRRIVKENLLKFDGTPLFPERLAYTVKYDLSEAEADLYKQVTDYVREEFNRAEALENDGREGTVGFALTILQRRLASSPEAIYQSLRRRRERLEKRLRELEILHRAGQATPVLAAAMPAFDDEDVDDLGKLQFAGRSLRELLIEAIRYGDQADVRARLTTVLEHALDRGQLQDLLEERALAHDAMDASRVYHIREDMERAEARRLQPHYIESFFHEAFRLLGGIGQAAGDAPVRGDPCPGPSAKSRPADRHRRAGATSLRADRLREVAGSAPGQPLAAFVCPGHPLLDSVIDLTLERHRDLLKRGAVLVDERDAGTQPRVLFYIEHTIQDASLTRSGERRVVSRRMLYVELDADGTTRHMHYAPYLDYRPLADGEPGVDAILDSARMCVDRPRDREEGAGLCDRPGRAGAPQGGARQQAQAHRQDRSRSKGPADQGDHLLGPPGRAAQAPGEGRQAQRQAQFGRGPQTGRQSSGTTAEAAGRAEARSPDLAFAAGGARRAAGGARGPDRGHDGKADDRQRPPRRHAGQCRQARAVVMAIERNLGFEPTDREFEKLGYDIESRVPGTGKLRFIEVKGRVTGAETITVTRNEILYSLNKPDDFILAIVEFKGDDSHRVHYIRQPFGREPDFGVTSVNYDFAELLARAREPS